MFNASKNKDLVAADVRLLNLEFFRYIELPEILEFVGFMFITMIFQNKKNLFDIKRKLIGEQNWNSIKLTKIKSTEALFLSFIKDLDRSIIQNLEHPLKISHT